jgi:hypothetical protein
MNNSKLALDSLPSLQELEQDNQPKLRAREAEILVLIEAIQGVVKTKEWSTLKTELFDNLVNVLEREIKDEAKKENPDTLKLNRLAGQLKWAEKYADLSKLEAVFRNELTSIRKQLYGTELNG